MQLNVIKKENLTFLILSFVNEEEKGNAIYPASPNDYPNVYSKKMSSCILKKNNQALRQTLLVGTIFEIGDWAFFALCSKAKPLNVTRESNKPKWILENLIWGQGWLATT